MDKLPDLIRRNFGFEVRAESTEQGSIITGRPIVYNSLTDLGWCKEVIERGALDKTDLTDVRFLVNHDFSKLPLARSRRNNANSTMQLAVDENGMTIHVLLDTENNQEARALYSAVERGDITGMSFAFSISDEEWTEIDTDMPTRHIKGISSVVECSAVTFPAYEDTEIYARDKASLERERAALESAKKQSRTNRNRSDELELEKLKAKFLYKNWRNIMKEYLKKILAAKQKRAADLRDLITNATTADEVRSYGNELTEVESEEREAQEQLNALVAAEQNAGAGPQQRFNPLATYSMYPYSQRNNDPDTSPLDTTEYRSAFMANVLHNTPIPANLRANANTLTSDVTSVLPPVLINQIIERMEECGMILPLVTRTSYAAGVVIPTSNVKPVATWVSEGKGSSRQKKTTGKITFSYFKLRCEISMSMEVGTMALAAFEAKFIENVSKAMVIAIEKAIINGDGTTQPKGILKETAAATVELAKAEPTYKELVDAEGKVPSEFEASAKWCMTKGTIYEIYRYD